MIDLDLKLNYLVAKYGKLSLARELEISYPYLIKLLEDTDKIMIKHLNMIEKLYKDSRNETE
jgi:hypothetical protein